MKMLFSDEANVVRVGSTFLNDKPIYLTSETLTSKFIPDLTDPDRTLSLILITTDEESKLPVRNLKNLTKQLFGMADIYVLDWHDRALMDTYREVFLKNTPAYDYGMECSSLKIYCKPVDLTVPTDNEMGMAYAKYLIDRYTRYGENRFINVLRQGICRASDRVAGDILSIADVRWLDGIDEAKRLSSRIKKLKQRVKGDSGGNETVDSLRDEISGLQKDIADWEEIASELETSNSEAAAKIDMLTRDAMRLENEKRAVERKLEMAELEQLNANALNGIRKALTVVPENLTQLLDLAKVLYPDRIVILPDAYRSAKKFDGILTEEWEILVAVATTLWDLCFKETVIVYSLRSTPRALDILCLAVSWELMEKYIKSRDIRFLFGFPFLGVCIANLHGALWPCAIMLPLAALLDSKLDPNARVALAVTILLTIASAMLNPYGLDVLSLPFKTIGTSDIATVAVPELKPMFSIVPVEAVILIVISVVPVIFHAKCLGFKKTVFSFETMMISGLLFLSLMTWRNELLLLGILMIVYSTWCWKLEPKCKVSSKMLSRIVLFSISVVALEFGAVLFYSTLSATDQKSISLERKITRRGLSRQRRARAWPITHSRNSLLRSVTMTCSKIPLYAMSFLPGAVTQKRSATVMPVPCQIMVRTMFVLPVRRERTLFSSRLLNAVALANRAIRMSSIK